MINKMKKKRNTLDETPCIVTVSGEPASKANSRRLVMMGGKPRFIKSKKALGYSSGFNTQVGCRKELIEDDVCIAIKIFYKSRGLKDSILGKDLSLAEINGSFIGQL